MIIPLERAC